mmetsp:Transcript_54530/g.169299  ORF Transcript_54530/g.169299 Transcript_54530/m.169299 type:complete len:365 (-) Transcript_54530:99-1193(-)
MEQQRWTPSVFLDAFRAYTEHSQGEVARVRRNLTGLSADDRNSLTWKPEDQVKKMEEAVSANLLLLNQLATFAEEQLAAPATFADWGARRPCPPQGTQPVQSLLQMLVREWSAEGLAERRDCFDQLLGALDGHLRQQLEQASASGAAAPRVLCAGAQLGRLLFEVQSRGYSGEGCESRALPFIGGEFVRRHCARRETHRIQPYVLQTCNRFRAEDHVRVIPIPDVDVGEERLPRVRFGSFLHIYDVASARGSFDALLTAFSLDTSANVFRYVRTAAHVVRPGGLWANFGPLAYETDHDDAHGHGVELSWEELRFAVSHFFDVQYEAFVDSLNAANAESMMQVQYSCICFRAVRNSNPSPGIGEE